MRGRLRFLIHDRDALFTAALSEVFKSEELRIIHPCPSWLATTAIDATVTVVATADGRLGGRGNNVTIGCRERPRLHEFARQILKDAGIDRWTLTRRIS